MCETASRRWGMRAGGHGDRALRGRFAGPGRSLTVERLESRALLSISAQAQHFIYLLNRARHDPATYEDEVALPNGLLDGVAAQPPLAVNTLLTASAEFHSQEMATYNYFAHQSAVTGDWPNGMARDAGYALPSYFPDAANYIESLAAGYNTGVTPDPYSRADAPLRALILDEGINPPGHRNHLLGIGSFYAANREIGVGYAHNASATYRNYWTIHATRQDPAGTFLTGVVYNDANANQRYDMGEGLGGVDVRADSLQTATNAQGGWSLPITSGQYTVTASGGGFAGLGSTVVTVGSDNREIDFLSGYPAAMVDFAWAGAADQIGVHRADRFLLDENASLAWEGTSGGDVSIGFGAAGDVPLVGDWNGDGTDGLGAQRGDRFYLDANGNGRWDGVAGGDRLDQFGAVGDVPLAGDFDGNGTAEIGTHRGDRFYLDTNGNGRWDGPVLGDRLIVFGAAGDTPLIGDFSGDGLADVGVHRGNMFYLDANGNGRWDGVSGGDVRHVFGAVGDMPLVGNWNGAGADEVAVRRGDRFYLDIDGNGTWGGGGSIDRLVVFGVAGDRPIAGRWTSWASSTSNAVVPDSVAGPGILSASEPLLFPTPDTETGAESRVSEFLADLSPATNVFGQVSTVWPAHRSDTEQTSQSPDIAGVTALDRWFESLGESRQGDLLSAWWLGSRGNHRGPGGLPQVETSPSSRIEALLETLGLDEGRSPWEA